VRTSSGSALPVPGVPKFSTPPSSIQERATLSPPIEEVPPSSDSGPGYADLPILTQPTTLGGRMTSHHYSNGLLSPPPKILEGSHPFFAPCITMDHQGNCAGGAWLASSVWEDECAWFVFFEREGGNEITHGAKKGGPDAKKGVRMPKWGGSDRPKKGVPKPRDLGHLQ